MAFEKTKTLYSTRRIEALSDGVFAIAMTLLVLGLKFGEFGSANTSAELWQNIANNSTMLISLIVSFLMLGSAWSVHLRQFENIKKTDLHFIFINTFRLLLVVFMPLTASIAGNYNTLVLGRILLPLNYALITIVSAWQWRYALKEENRFDEGLSDKEREYFGVRNTAAIITSLAVVVGSIFIGQAAFMLFFAMPILIKILPSKKS